MPAWISDIVSADNKCFLADSQLFNEQSFDFLKEIFKVIGSDMVLSAHTFEYSY